MTAILLLAGLALLLAGAELLVRGASRLAAALSIPPLVIGLTVVAFGTSAPELAVSVQAALDGRAGIALGNVVGSNIFNVLLILGLSALIAPLVVSRTLVRIEVPIMIGVSLLLVAMGWNGHISRAEGAVLAILGIVYTWLQIRAGRRQESHGEPAEQEPRPAAGGWWRHASLIVIGLGMLLLGARWLVEGATVLARALGVSELIIGLTVIACGTSLPEVATSVLASLRRERDIAVGNVVGSNIFNILWVLGLAAVAAAGGVEISPAAWRFDMPVMVAAAVACLPIFFTGYVIARWEGGLFVGYYLAYVTFIVLAAVQSPALRAFSNAMVGFVVPLTVLTVGVLAARSLRRPAPEASAGEAGDDAPNSRGGSR